MFTTCIWFSQKALKKKQKKKRQQEEEEEEDEESEEELGEEPEKPDPPEKPDVSTLEEHVREKAARIRRKPGEPLLIPELTVSGPVTPNEQCPRWMNTHTDTLTSDFQVVTVFTKLHKWGPVHTEHVFPFFFLLKLNSTFKNMSFLTLLTCVVLMAPNGFWQGKQHYSALNIKTCHMLVLRISKSVMHLSE